MANEQVVITKDNYGIELQVQFLDSKKKPIQIENDDTVEICFISPSLNKEYKQAYMIDSANGVCGFILEQEQTNEINLWKTYWSLVDNNNFITSQEALYYYVMDKEGGVA